MYQNQIGQSPKTRDKTIAFLGAGNMGGALIQGIRERELVPAACIWAADVCQERLEYLKNNYHINVTTDNQQAVSEADIIILAVKPQQLGSLLAEIGSLVDENKLVISIAAGITLAYLQSQLGDNIRIIRVMPNMPALVGAGMTALCGGKQARPEDLELGKEIFGCVGETVVLEEVLMDAVTGLSGSGPAYVMVVIEALADAGVKLGLPRDKALQLATQTVLGSAKLLKEKGLHPAQLRDMVSSPGGTTIAGLFELERGGVRAALIDAVEAATRRSKELGK
jgi:pyrroline-5-carboxylate reductase